VVIWQSLPRCLRRPPVMRIRLTDSWMTPSMSRLMLLNRDSIKRMMRKIAIWMILLKAKRMTTMKRPSHHTNRKNQPKRPVESTRRRRSPRKNYLKNKSLRNTKMSTLRPQIKKKNSIQSLTQLLRRRKSHLLWKKRQMSKRLRKLSKPRTRLKMRLLQCKLMLISSQPSTPTRNSCIQKSKRYTKMRNMMPRGKWCYSRQRFAYQNSLIRKNCNKKRRRKMHKSSCRRQMTKTRRSSHSSAFSTLWAS
jgi:hypothetical protein